MSKYQTKKRNIKNKNKSKLKNSLKKNNSNKNQTQQGGDVKQLIFNVISNRGIPRSSTRYMCNQCMWISISDYFKYHLNNHLTVEKLKEIGGIKKKKYNKVMYNNTKINLLNGLITLCIKKKLKLVIFNLNKSEWHINPLIWDKNPLNDNNPNDINPNEVNKTKFISPFKMYLSNGDVDEINIAPLKINCPDIIKQNIKPIVEKSDDVIFIASYGSHFELITEIKYDNKELYKLKKHISLQYQSYEPNIIEVIFPIKDTNDLKIIEDASATIDHSSNTIGDITNANFIEVKSELNKKNKEIKDLELLKDKLSKSFFISNKEKERRLLTYESNLKEAKGTKEKIENNVFNLYMKVNTSIKNNGITKKNKITTSQLLKNKFGLFKHKLKNLFSRKKK